MRPVPTAAALGLVLLVLGGCGGPSDAPGPDTAKAVAVRLGGDPDQLYQQEVVFKTVGSDHFASQVVFLVPSKDGKSFQIVDSHGRVYRDYNDFLRNNRLPD